MLPSQPALSPHHHESKTHGSGKHCSCTRRSLIPWELLLLLLLLLLRQSRRRWVLPPHKEPVVDIPQGVWHERLHLVMAPLAIHNELVLVVPAGKECPLTSRIPDSLDCIFKTARPSHQLTLVEGGPPLKTPLANHP